MNQKKEIENIKEFCKLFKVHIPYHEEFDYYIDVLSQSYQYSDIKELVKEFIEFEEWCKNEGYENAVDYKMNYAFPKIKDYLYNSNSYQNFNKFDYSNDKLSKFDNFKKHIKEEYDKDFISIDLKSANYSVLKFFDYENDLPKNWYDLLQMLDIHPIIAKSKSFRQVIFGNLNPKRNGKVQSLIMNRLMNKLEEKKIDQQVIALYEDEIIFSNNFSFEDSFVFSQFLQDIISEFRYEYDHKLERNNFLDFQFNINIFKCREIKKDIFLKHYSSQDWEKLIGVPGNQFYMYFKKHILKEPIEERDLYFVNDGKLAKWIEHD